MYYGKDGYRNEAQRKVILYVEECGSTVCAIEGCTYNTTHDMHRLVPGRDGGLYEIGNMFSLCPNHHAEIERGIIVVNKVDNCTLRIV